MNDGKRAFDTARTNLWMFDPNELVIIEDENDALYDPRVKLPLDPALVQNILYQGVLEPVVIVKREGDAVVVDGRQRVRAAREAVKIAKERGLTEVKVPAVLRRTDDRGALAVMISANEIRQDDGPLQRAEKCQRLLAAGYTEEELCTLFGKTKNTINNWLSLLEVFAPVRKAIERGELAASAAPQLKNLPKEEQLAAVEEAKTKGNGRASVKGVRKGMNKPTAPRMRNRTEIEERIKTRGLPPDYREALKWVLRRGKEE
jgi:ParB family chromosome partitioning protein